MATRALMIQGTGSDVGKSVLVAGLCRVLVRRGARVRPFKPQNMSNNAAVTADGGEIGRAQALQALACGAEPSVHMNPILLKPQSDVGAQLIVQGRVVGNFRAREYHAKKPGLMAPVLDSFARIGADADFVLVEGAGSPAEINLRAGDIANMGFAEAARVPVVLVADIERGGVIASLVGTWSLMSDSERTLTKGFIVNKFRGDVSLFADGERAIEARTGMVSFGVLPHLASAIRLPQEDTMALSNAGNVHAKATLRIAIPRLPHISNFDDFDPLAAEPEVSLEFIAPGRPLPGDADLVILPGSKTTLADLAVFRAEGWDIDLAAHVRRGGAVLGICGGYQMLGRTVADPNGIEGTPGQADGLGLLDVETVLTERKTLGRFAGTDISHNVAVRGYEMHMGRTEGADCARPMLCNGARSDGAVSADGRIMGCYVHGLFVEDGFRRAYLNSLNGDFSSTFDYTAGVQAALEDLADAIEAHLDVDRLIATSAPIG
ncbi:MAG: cobalamin biosynthesis protein CobQ [Rhodospirillales bacterium]|jgi:adenosylcobyric acid synthase|nr:cobalamin biosynthesis protein CobQ [Rhodospirillales bacterium]